MATVNLGSIKFKWKGTYSGATAYTVDDVVEYNGSSYICKLASTGNLPTNTTYFDVMSSAGTNGTNGTDVGTVITTQGDLLYRDGSGLQRLGAGTAGQVLQTGGAGANPSWTNLSSDFVLLETINASSSSSVSFDGYFSSTYKNYILYVSNMTISASGTTRFRFRRNNADVTATDVYTHMAYYGDSYPQNESDQISRVYSDYNVDNDTRILGGGSGQFSSSTKTINFESIIYDPLGTDNNKSIQTNWAYASQNGIWQIGRSMTTLTDATTALSGFTFYQSTGLITRGNFKLYGLK